MHIVDLIIKKRDGGALSDDETAFFVNGSVSGDIADYQISAMLMAMLLRGMSARETAVLTDKMARSGDMVDLSPIPGIKVDKHSTGGVGDKTTLAVGPIVAACGVPVAKMSGRGLGHTGGTLDKLESIPGLSVSMDRERFFDIVRSEGLAVIGQTGNLARADKIFYALRDVTGTVESLPLIASSIISKKLAAGADAIVLDVKCGSGAFMKNYDDALELARTMVNIGEANGRRTIALITNMDRPLGCAVGNSLEVIEAVDTLKMRGPSDFTELCLAVSAEMLHLAGKGELPLCRQMAENALLSGKAFERLSAMVAAQGGDSSVLDDPSLFGQAPHRFVIAAPVEGFISRMETSEIGMTAAILGAGRTVKTDPVDRYAGLIIRKKTGDFVRAGDTLAEAFTSKPETETEVRERFLSAITFGEKTPPQKLIYARVTSVGTETF